MVQQTQRQVIKEHMARMAPGVTQEDKTWTSTYHAACTEVIDGLTAEETRECERMANDWNATGPDDLTKAM